MDRGNLVAYSKLVSSMLSDRKVYSGWSNWSKNPFVETSYSSSSWLLVFQNLLAGLLDPDGHFISLCRDATLAV